MKPTFLIMSTKIIISCQMEGFILFKRTPPLSDAKKCDENRGQLFTEMEWKKCSPFLFRTRAYISHRGSACITSMPEGTAHLIQEHHTHQIINFLTSF